MRRRATRTAAEPQPSLWQGTDPIAAIEDLGPLVFHAAAKDTRINEPCKVNGVLDDRFSGATGPPVGLGGHWTLNRWPPRVELGFDAVCRGHGAAHGQRALRGPSLRPRT